MFVKRALPILLEILFVGTVILSLRTEPDADDVADAPATSARSWWVDFEKDDGSIGCPSAVPASLVWLISHHNDDGSWGQAPAQLEGRPLGKTGLTALALLPLLGAGYLPTSKDGVVHEGGEYCFGKEITRGLDWLRRQPPADGSLDRILAAFALSEAYGMTAHTVYRKPAQDAVDAVIRLQKPDGSWENAGTTAWAILALYSAKQSELSVDPGVLDRALHGDPVPEHPGEALARILTRNRAVDAVERLKRESTQQERDNLAWWYLATMALWSHDGHRRDGSSPSPGPIWDQWSRGMKEKLLPTMRRDGSVEGRDFSDTVVRTSLLQLIFEIYYRYANVPAPR